MSQESAVEEIMAWAQRWGVEDDALIPIFGRLRDTMIFIKQVGGQDIPFQLDEVPPAARRELADIIERGVQS